MEEKKKATEAHMRATKKYEDKAYFKTLVRFPKAKESEIREAAGKSLNGFIVTSVLEKLEREQRKGEAETTSKANAEQPKEDETVKNPEEQENLKRLQEL